MGHPLYPQKVNNNIPSGGQIEAVVHFRENENGDIDYQNGDNDDDIDIGDVLVDSQNNKYVLSKPKDSTAPLIDHHLVMDIIMVLLICLPFGMLCEKVALPTLFGYVMTGVLLGPSGLNVLKSMVSPLKDTPTICFLAEIWSEMIVWSFRHTWYHF